MVIAETDLSLSLSLYALVRYAQYLYREEERVIMPIHVSAASELIMRVI